MSPEIDHSYESPSVTEYGRVESITKSNSKCGTETDQESDGTPLTGSIVNTSECA